MLFVQSPVVVVKGIEITDLDQRVKHIILILCSSIDWMLWCCSRTRCLFYLITTDIFVVLSRRAISHRNTTKWAVC